MLALSRPSAAHELRLKDPARLAALQATGLLEPEREPALDRFTRLAASWLRAPVALLTLVSERQQLFKSAWGVPARPAGGPPAPLDAFCQHVVGSAEPLLVRDAREHGLLHRPVIGGPDVVAYAGVPLLTPERHALGVLCVLDVVRRKWTEKDAATLRELGSLLQTELALRERTRALEQAQAAHAASRAALAQGEAALARSEALLRTVARNLPQAALLVFDRDLRCQLPEPSPLLAELGFQSAPGGKTLAEVAPAAQLAVLEASFRQVLAGKRLDHEVARGQHVYSLSLIPVRDPSAAVSGGVMLTRDVTAERRAQLALRGEMARTQLLQTLAATVSEGRSTEAFQRFLDALGPLTGYPLAHLYVAHEGELSSSVCWYDRAPERFATLRQQRGQLRFTRSSADLIGQALAARRALALTELSAPACFQHAEAAHAAGLRSAVACPILLGREVVAVLELYSESEQAPEPRWLELLSSAANLLGRVVERDRARRALARQTERARHLSTRDELTGLSNRRGFLELGAQHLRLAERSERPAVLLLLDLEGLGQLNAEHGREQGDRALLDTADVLRAALRSSDILGRLGGDEFVALLPEASPAQAHELRERILGELAERSTRGQRRYRLTASIATAVFDPDTRESIEQLLERAELVLHEEQHPRPAIPAAAAGASAE